MRLHRFYIKEKIDGQKEVTVRDEGLIHQWRNVFRMKARERVILFDGSGNDFECEILSLDKKEIKLSVVGTKKGIVPDKEIWLFASLVKKDNFELVLQKCTELGVSHFVPVISGRSEKKGLNTERAGKILIEASEQSGRAVLPVLHEIIPLEQAVKDYRDKISLIAFDSSGPRYSLLPTTYSLGLFVGPEGGFTAGEIELFKQNNIPVYSLGQLTLRAETAAVAAVASYIL